MESGSGGEQPDDDDDDQECDYANDGPHARDRHRPAKATPPLHKEYQINDAIGKALQAHFRALAEEPLPDRFKVLLAELEAKDPHDDK